MWYFTAYILYEYILKKFGRDQVEKEGVILDFKEFSEFIFGKLWGEFGLVFHDTVKDLENEISYLQDLGLLEYSNSFIKVRKEHFNKLEKIAKDVETSPSRKEVKLIDEYLTRIRRAIERIEKP